MAARARAIRPLPLFVEVLGWLMLLAALALLSPGVVYRASAEPDSSAPLADGPSCSPGEAVRGDRLITQLEQHIATLRAQVEAQPADASSDRVVPLNTSGYHYPRVSPPAAQAQREPDSR